ncbi:unnamed protein product [Ixodes persulcatus]
MVRGSLFGVIILSWGALEVCNTRDIVPGPDAIRANSAFLKLENSLNKFASSLLKFEEKSLKILDLDSRGSEEYTGLRSLGSNLISEEPRESHHGSLGSRVAATSHLASRSAYDSKHSNVTNNTNDDNVLKKRGDDAVRIIRIKIVHHKDDENATTGASKSTSNATLTGHSTSVSTAPGHTAFTTLRTTLVRKMEPTAQAVPGRYCAKNEEQARLLAEAAAKAASFEQENEETTEVEDEQHDHEEHRNCAPHVEKNTSSGDHLDIDTKSPSPSMRSAVTLLCSAKHSSEKTTMRLFRNHKATPRPEQRHYKVGSNERLQIQIIKKPPSGQKKGNETIFANHTVVLNGSDIVVKTDDHFSIMNASRTGKIRKSRPVARDSSGKDAQIGQDSINEFDKKVKQINESLQRIWNYDKVSKQMKVRSGGMLRNSSSVVLHVKTNDPNDQYRIDNGFQKYRARKSEPRARQISENDTQFRQDYINQFEKRVKQLNESLQRIRNSDEQAKWKKSRSRRAEGVQSMRTLRHAPDGVVTANKSQKSQANAKPGNIRIIFNMRQTAEGSSTTLPTSNPNGHKKDRRWIDGGQKAGKTISSVKSHEEPDDSSRSRSQMVLQEDPKSAFTNLMKHNIEDSFPNAALRGDLKLSSNKSQDPLLELLSQVATQIDYSESLQPESKYKRLRNRALILTCVLSAASVFTVVVVLTMLYFDVQKCLRFKRSFRYLKYDMSIPLNDYLEESRPLTQ